MWFHKLWILEICRERKDANIYYQTGKCKIYKCDDKTCDKKNSKNWRHGYTLHLNTINWRKQEKNCIEEKDVRKTHLCLLHMRTYKQSKYKNSVTYIFNSKQIYFYFITLLSQSCWCLKHTDEFCNSDVYPIVILDVFDICKYYQQIKFLFIVMEHVVMI